MKFTIYYYSLEHNQIELTYWLDINTPTTINTQAFPHDILQQDICGPDNYLGACEKDRYSGSIRESDSGLGRVELTNLKF